MTNADQANFEQRLLVLTPTGKDAVLTQYLLERAGVTCLCCRDLDQVCEALDAGAGALLIAEEALSGGQGLRLEEWLNAQPPWSDLPVLFLARPGAESSTVAQSMEFLRNVIILERPLRIAALISAVRASQRSRQRQYQRREQLLERDRHIQVQSHFAAIVADSADAIISKTLEGIIRSWNVSAERLFGYSAEEAIGQSITILVPTERRDEEPILLGIVRRGERIEQFETIRVAKDGRRIDISLTISPIRDGAGTIIGVSTIARDITQSKRTEEALRLADQRKDEFLAILSHELRNPLAPIRNSLHILRLTARNDPTADRVSEMMERQVNHMVRLVDDLLEVSRISRGKIELRKEPIEVSAIIRSAVETSQSVIEDAGHQLIIAIPPEPLMVEGDKVRLSQVFSNLLNNAAKYMDTGGHIWLTVRRDNETVAISVRDTGRGIPPEMLSRVFELFTQIDRPGNQGQGGLGIGLALVKSLVELHGGSVQANSDGSEKGSEFVVRLPLDARLQPTPTKRPTIEPRRKSFPSRVLVVDDNRDAAESLGMLLKLLGADVRLVFNGRDALEAVGDFRPVVVLLDIGLPDIDGHEVARRIRQKPEFNQTTLIALTGWGQEGDRQSSKLAGFDFHLIKPADLSVLESLLVSLQARI